MWEINIFTNNCRSGEHPDEGQIMFDGHPVTETSPERIMVFQEGALFPWLKVQDNVEFGLKMAGIPKERTSKDIQ